MTHAFLQINHFEKVRELIIQTSMDDSENNKHGTKELIDSLVEPMTVSQMMAQHLPTAETRCYLNTGILIVPCLPRCPNQKPGTCHFDHGPEIPPLAIFGKMNISCEQIRLFTFDKLLETVTGSPQTCYPFN